MTIRADRSPVILNFLFKLANYLHFAEYLYSPLHQPNISVKMLRQIKSVGTVGTQVNKFIIHHLTNAN